MGNHRQYSKGCGTCLKRRVKCDERHPFCKRCEKGGFSCDGYKQAEFVDAREQIDKRTAPQSKPKSIQCKSAPSDNKLIQGHDDALNHKTSPCGTNHGEQLETIGPAGRIPESISSPSLADEVYVCFTLENLCKGPAAVMYSYSDNLCGRCATESTMNQCLLALATIFYGIRHHEMPILYDGMRRYGRGLGMLKEAVAGKNFDVTTETIVSVWILSVIDCIKPNTKFAWMTHILSLERLFSLRGSISNANSTILDRALLETCRPLLILTAFFTKTPSIMSNTEWRVTSQVEGSSSESFMSNQNLIAISDLDVVMEFLAELPALFLQVDEYIQASRAHDSSPSSTRIFMVYTSISHFQQRLQPVGERLYEEDVGMDGISPTTTTNTSGTIPRATSFRFKNPEHAITLSMYNATLILLNSIPIALLKASLVDPFVSIAETSDHAQTIQIQSLLSETKSLMHEIHQSVEYYLDLLEPAEAPADYYLFFPMYVASRASIQHGFEEERTWLLEASKAMEDKFRMGACAQMDFDGRFSGLGEGLFG